MCLGSAAPTWKPPEPKIIEPGPESPNDMVNGIEVENINDRSQQQKFRDENTNPVASKQSQSSSKTNRAY